MQLQQQFEGLLFAILKSAHASKGIQVMVQHVRERMLRMTLTPRLRAEQFGRA